MFNDFDAPAVRWALHTALDLFKDRDAWQQMMRNGMAQDFSWDRQSREYVKLYESCWLTSAPCQVDRAGFLERNLLHHARCP